MNMTINGFKKLLLPAAIAAAFLAGCATMESPEGSAEVRAKLTQLQSDAELASRAPVAINAAELSVREAEQPTEDEQLARHRVFIADHKIDIAAAQAENRLLEDQRALLKEETANARLDSRTREAELARIDANSARNDAEVLRNEAYEARKETEAAQQETQAAQQETVDAQEQARAAQQEKDDLQKQIEELNAKATERGLVVTLGDVLFDTGRSELKGGASVHLSKLATFLNKYQDRTVLIEGHTDNTGSESTNFSLSQRRADAVQSYLLAQGVISSRVNAVGKGENYPVAGNDSVSGRQMNRRVEVIITNTAIATSTK